MKKFICLLVICFGFYLNAQSQCAITLTNNSTNPYSVTYQDGSGNQNTITANGSGGSNTQVIQNFAFNLTWNGFNANGCNTNQVVITAAPASGVEFTPCLVPNSATWSFTQNGGAAIPYSLNITIN